MKASKLAETDRKKSVRLLEKAIKDGDLEHTPVFLADLLREEDERRAIELHKVTIANGGERLAAGRLASMLPRENASEQCAGLPYERRGARRPTQSAPSKGEAPIGATERISRNVNIEAMSIADFRNELASRVLPLDRMAVIAFTSDPREHGFADEGIRSALLVRCDDVSGAKPGALTEAQADEVAEFLVHALHGEEGTAQRIVFCCDGGISRSVAAASALARFVGSELAVCSSVGSVRPNKHVAREVLQGLERTTTPGGLNPLRRHILQELQAFEDARRTGACLVENDAYRIALECDLYASDDVVRSSRRVNDGEIDRLLPDGAWIEGRIYMVSGDAAIRLARRLETRLVAGGYNVVSIGARKQPAVFEGGRDVKLSAAASLATNGPDGAALLRSELRTLEANGKRIDVIIIEDLKSAKAA